MNDDTHVFLGMKAVVVSEQMRRMIDMAERVARSNATVLVLGESGSGKEVIARAIHHFSTRAQKPWVDLSCAALPEHLIESELFGYDKGAFSGADTHKPGLFELAHQGTIFLDEIGELDMKMQVKLLRVLDGVPYYRLGGVKKVAVDVRVVAATNQDLEIAVAEGRFRADLYHRLSQIALRVPPLRNRLEDIAPLAKHFLAQHDPRLRFSGAALEALTGQPWPGNIRELRNTVIKAAVLAVDDEIRLEDLPLPMQPVARRSFGESLSGLAQAAGWEAPAADWDAPASLQGDREQRGSASAASSSSGGDTAAPHALYSERARRGTRGGPTDTSCALDRIERRAILEALAATGGHQQKAAARLGISRRTLSRKLKLYDSERAELAL